MSHVRMRCTLGCQWVRPSLPCTASAHNTFFTYLCIQHVPIVKLNFSKGIKSKEVHARFHYILEKSAKKEQKILKVVGNDKEGGPGRWQTSAKCLEPWRTIEVYIFKVWTCTFWVKLLFPIPPGKLWGITLTFRDLVRTMTHWRMKVAWVNGDADRIRIVNTELANFFLV